MYMKNQILLLFVAALFAACGGKTTATQNISGETRKEFNRVSDIVNQLQVKVQNPEQFSSKEGIAEIKNLGDALSFDFDPAGMDSLTLAQCMDLQKKTIEVKQVINTQLELYRQSSITNMVVKDDYLLEKKEAYPIYLERGDKLMFTVEGEKALDVKLYNADSKQLLKTYSGKALVSDSLPISFKAIYLLEVNPRTTQYSNIRIGYRPGSMDRMLYPKQVKTETVEANQNDFRVTSVKGIKMKNLFEEPRKFTLRGQLKAAFSGNDRAIVAVQIPSGATDILYSLRISTNEGDRYSDGKFHDNMETSYRKIKMLGMPVYESHKGASIISTLLGENCPPREEDAYINLFVFYNASQAKKFQDGAATNTLSYNIDYSKMGTQSCNDRIPAKGCKTIYLGFQNERMRYNNYVWLEAVSAVANNEYFREAYSVE